MDSFVELSLLTANMAFEVDGDRPCQPLVDKSRLQEIPITEAQMPNGKRIKLLKTLLSSACERNCYYCPFRTGRDMRRATFTPEKMANIFIQLYQAKIVEGMFLSSGVVGGGVRTQDKLIDVADILRRKYGYRGYLHLKIMPGVERDQVEKAMHLASRVSVNLEAPNTKRLIKLAPHKAFTEELLEPLAWVEEIRATKSPHVTWNGRWPSSVTQFVVGAVGETDVELLATSAHLYQTSNITRAYFSKFSPVPDTPFENLPPASEVRQHRLYQSSFLIRDYGFELEDMPFDEHGNLPLQKDPKLVWAEQFLKPVEVNTATRNELLKVPGIGPVGVDRILKARKIRCIRELSQLRKLGIQPERLASFILLNGRKPAYQPLLL